MTKKIFKGMIFAAMLSMVACMLFILGSQYEYYCNSQKESLKSKAEIISNYINETGKLKNINERVTIIEHNGTVSFDNKADVSRMENHLKREEVAEAFINKTGYSVRKSATLIEKTCYYAILLNDGRVLRVSDTRQSVFAFIIKLLPPICAIVILVFVLSIIIASIISKRIVKPINNLSLEDYNNDIEYDELAPLISKLKKQRSKIDNQIEELSKSRKQFEAISDNINEGLAITDNNGHIISYNKSIQKIFNITGSIEGKKILVLNHSENFRKLMESIIEGKSYNTIIENESRFYSVSSSPVIGENGIVSGCVLLVVDTTEKEKLERMRQEFTANVSHELKTPLTSIIGISDMLKSGIIEQQDVAGFGADINKEAVRLLALVNDIIKLSELDEGNEDLTNETTDLFEQAKEVVKRLSSYAEKEKINISVTGESALIKASESLIFEMIYNLCDNAIKYNKPNGNVIIATGRTNDNLFITVKDSGIGIKNEYLDRIFERFYRVDKGRSRQNGGTGLGLSIVKHICAVTEGQIKIDSIPGVGTTIQVLYPL